MGNDAHWPVAAAAARTRPTQNAAAAPDRDKLLLFNPLLDIPAASTAASTSLMEKDIGTDVKSKSMAMLCDLKSNAWQVHDHEGF